ncbi:hypothetical protein BD560DRAFT_395479 [Blakeslea trispora]|nr:hypothetical protein BD560DRAFT_395479 [Blakeslea trispora]
MNNSTLADIVQKIASQGNNPDVSFLKDNPEAQTMLLLALLSNNNTNNNQNQTNVNNTITPSLTPDTSPSADSVEKRKYDAFNFPNSPSPIQSPTSPTKSAITDSSKPKKVGRKPLTSEEEDSDNPKTKRKAQNRAAQRAFRERKENHVRVLEEKVKELEQQISQQSSKDLLLENEKLKETIQKLQEENQRLLGSTASFDLPLSSKQSEDDARPQKLIRSFRQDDTPSPISHFDSLSSTYSSSSKSRSNTPEAHQPLSIDDILKTDSLPPSNTLIDHSELLGLSSDQFKLDDFLDQQKFSFTTDPSQFDFFYPLEGLPAQPIEQAHPSHEEVTKMWDNISDHPRFDEIDMDDLCDKMTKKATCSEKYNHDKELKKLIDEQYPIL